MRHRVYIASFLHHLSFLSVSVETLKKPLFSFSIWVFFKTQYYKRKD